jgi:hypothetical protein
MEGWQWKSIKNEAMSGFNIGTQQYFEIQHYKQYLFRGISIVTYGLRGRA